MKYCKKDNFSGTEFVSIFNWEERKAMLFASVRAALNSWSTYVFLEYKVKGRVRKLYSLFCLEFWSISAHFSISSLNVLKLAYFTLKTDALPYTENIGFHLSE
jgi:hypothetical protein